MMKKKYLLQLLLIANFLFFSFDLKAQHIVQLQQGKPTSIRGLSVVDDSIAWLSGSKGYIAITHNGGKNWTWQQVKGFEKADFRDIEAFSDKEAVIMSSGTPAMVLKTIDGGANWQVKYRNTDSAYFFDAMDFADKKHGFILGDPIDNKFLLMESKDGGENWSMSKNRPDALPGEAAFAASGTCLSTNGMLAIVTGGSHSRILFSQLENIHWTDFNLFMPHEKASQGAFSIARGRHQTIVVGGDYANDKRADSVAVTFPRIPHSGEELSTKGPDGFQSCVAYITGETFVSTGTPGSNITINGGKTWIKIDGASFNVCRKAKHGKLVLFAGNEGITGILKM
jgi:photosystem II stability/assembly factor-like uncharacterized protein